MTFRFHEAPEVSDSTPEAQAPRRLNYQSFPSWCNFQREELSVCSLSFPEFFLRFAIPVFRPCFEMIESAADPMPEKSITDTGPQASKRNKRSVPELRVVLDSNTTYIEDSATDFLRSEVINLISESKHPDLRVGWYLPEVVRHERQFQMQSAARRLWPSLQKVQRLIGHNLALTEQSLVDDVEAHVSNKIQELGIQEIVLDYGHVNWPTLVRAALYRTPPFNPGQKEKGFRDALIAEAFLQLLGGSPVTPSVCRVVLVTNDGLLTRAVTERIRATANASILANIGELKGLINTIVSNAGEDFIARMRSKAAKLFFEPDDKNSLIYKAKIQERLKAEFSSVLAAKPTGTTFRDNGNWIVDIPNFAKKEGRTIFWRSRMEIEFKAGITRVSDAPTGAIFGGLQSAKPLQEWPSRPAAGNPAIGSWLKQDWPNLLSDPHPMRRLLLRPVRMSLRWTGGQT